MEAKRILIADNHTVSGSEIKKVLLEKSFLVVGEADTGKNAMELNNILKPDLMIMNVKMPHINGIETLKEINLHSDNPVPVILITDSNDRYTIEHANIFGAMACLMRPVSMDELIPNIEIAITRFKEFMELKKKNANLKEALEVRKLIDKAKSILMKNNDVSEEDAHRKLQKLSMDSHVAIKEIAKIIVMNAHLKIL